MNPVIRKATQADAQAMAPKLRRADYEELMHSTGGKKPVEALIDSIEASEASWAVEYKGHAVAIYGIGEHKVHPNVGVPWLLSTDELDVIWKPFLKGSREVIELFSEWYPVLTNAVDINHTKAQAWLEWLGFEPDISFPVGEYHQPFILYIRCPTNV